MRCSRRARGSSWLVELLGSEAVEVRHAESGLRERRQRSEHRHRMRRRGRRNRRRRFGRQGLVGVHGASLSLDRPQVTPPRLLGACGPLSVRLQVHAHHRLVRHRRSHEPLRAVVAQWPVGGQVPPLGRFATRLAAEDREQKLASRLGLAGLDVGGADHDTLVRRSRFSRARRSTKAFSRAGYWIVL